MSSLEPRQGVIRCKQTSLVDWNALKKAWRPSRHTEALHKIYISQLQRRKVTGLTATGDIFCFRNRYQNKCSSKPGLHRNHRTQLSQTRWLKFLHKVLTKVLVARAYFSLVKSFRDPFALSLNSGGLRASPFIHLEIKSCGKPQRISNEKCCSKSVWTFMVMDMTMQSLSGSVFTQYPALDEKCREIQGRLC
ncbi:uncharacterized protein N7484_010816 [Penicillium longicatenatum]|uniref:uncharacterized protein n=1 Tax=Penicillium longicatenatum TaxID=1561947 RepID=UPI002547DDEC|nr:uncharacterized protein N7484_010816 [Penicillium longicatenatum]KAJ5630716.1 hypothetical protein N7484_010816 [Penicillium longicatenatum]